MFNHENLINSGVAEITLAYSNVTPIKDRIKVITDVEAVRVLRSVWDTKTIELYESFKVMLLNNNNRLLGVITLSEGGITGTVADVRLIFAVALKSAATAIIVAHNHPSGNLTPSENDWTLTRKIMKAGDILDIKLIDHIILTKDSHFSFKEEMVHFN